LKCIKRGDYVKVIKSVSGRGHCYNKIGIVKKIYKFGKVRGYRILFLNGFEELLFGEDKETPIYINFINVWHSNELRILTKDEAMVELL